MFTGQEIRAMEETDKPVERQTVKHMYYNIIKPHLLPFRMDIKHYFQLLVIHPSISDFKS